MGNEDTPGFLRTGLELGKVGWYFGQELGSMALRGVSERMAPDVDDMVRSSCLKDAKIGLADKLRGRDQDIPELEFFGEAEMLSAVVRADDNPEVPEDHIHTIAHMIVEAGIEPPLSPLVDDETARRADRLVRSYQSVVRLSLRHNRLRRPAKVLKYKHKQY